ncbi:MAG: TraM recognition domain-containing protein, partial [Parcubacteria group bacterium]|nr:TraM recognition domain-containing protein [Parcubacteria group bacterium]
ALLGAMLITKIQLAAMERVRIPEEERVDFYLYVDEFQNFATDSFASILSEARKYRLNLLLAHQYVGQLVTDVSTKVRDAVFGNVGTMIMFRIGAADAEFLENEFDPEFTPQDMVNLPNYCIYLKLMCDGVTSRPFSAITLVPFRIKSPPAHIEEVIEASRNLYAVPREKVEEEINRWSSLMGLGDAPPYALEGQRARERGGVPAEPGMKYSAVCSSCGKTTELNFRPTEGRPVYCRECLAKIKSGEMQRVRFEKAKTPKTEQKYLSDLGGMGIEFDAPPEPARGGGMKLPSRFVEETSDMTKSKDIMSLKDLKPEGKEKTPKIKKHEDVDIDELREAVKAALKSSLSENAGVPPHTEDEPKKG